MIHDAYDRAPVRRSPIGGETEGRTAPKHTFSFTCRLPSMLLGYDIGSSAIKAALLDPDTGNTVASARAPSDHEMSMEAPRPGWA